MEAMAQRRRAQQAAHLQLRCACLRLRPPLERPSSSRHLSADSLPYRRYTTIAEVQAQVVWERLPLPPAQRLPSQRWTSTQIASTGLAPPSRSSRPRQPLPPPHPPSPARLAQVHARRSCLRTTIRRADISGTGPRHSSPTYTSHPRITISINSARSHCLLLRSTCQSPQDLHLYANLAHPRANLRRNRPPRLRRVRSSRPSL